ncbi:MAG: hypothetical protein ACREBK_01830 [Sphingomicrobium sp.]
MFKFASIVILLAAAAPATAQNPPVGSAPQAKTQVDPLDRIVCRTEEGLGSRLNKKKVCMSQRDWKEQADDSRAATERMQQMHAEQMKPDG